MKTVILKLIILLHQIYKKIENSKKQFDNNHLDTRGQFAARMSGELIRKPDAAYKFISIVCSEVNISKLPVIEAMFKNSINKEVRAINN